MCRKACSKYLEQRGITLSATNYMHDYMVTRGGSSDESGEARAPLTAGNSMEPLLISPNKFEEEGEKRRREDKEEEESPFWSSILPPPLMVTKRTQEYIQWMRKLKDFVQQ